MSETERNADRALEALREHQPKFHPDSNEMVPSLEEALSRRPGQNAESYGRSFALGSGVLDYLAELDLTGLATTEVGAGYSTVLLATCARRHVVVNPDQGSNALIDDFVRALRPDADLHFVCESSDQGLPQVARSDERFDLALIDGNHSHPFPILDYHYLDLVLREGGLLVVDDAHIPAVGELVRTLTYEPAYDLVREIGTCVVYRKIRERQFGWQNQVLKDPVTAAADHTLDALRSDMHQALRGVVEDRESAMSGSPTPADETPEASDQAPEAGNRAASTPGPAELVTWYFSPSGAMFAASMVLLACGALGMGWEALPYLAGIVVFSIYTPYRSRREHRRNDQRAAAHDQELEELKTTAERVLAGTRRRSTAALEASADAATATELQARLGNDLLTRLRRVEDRLDRGSDTD